MSEVTFTILNSGDAFFDGVKFDLFYVKNLKDKYKSKLKMHPKRMETITRSKVLGAIEDGIDTVVDAKVTSDYLELVIDVPLEVEIELMEKVRKAKEAGGETLDKREPRA